MRTAPGYRARLTDQNTICSDLTSASPPHDVPVEQGGALAGNYRKRKWGMGDRSAAVSIPSSDLTTPEAGYKLLNEPRVL